MSKEKDIKKETPEQKIPIRKERPKWMDKDYDPYFDNLNQEPKKEETEEEMYNRLKNRSFTI
jgi:hypothetical protein